MKPGQDARVAEINIALAGESGTTLPIREVGESELHEDLTGHGENNLTYMPEYSTYN